MSRAAKGTSPAAAGVPRLHLVTDDEVLARPDFGSRAASAMRAGGSRVALHVRGPTTSGRLLFDLVAALVGTARSAGAWLVVNDRVDVALAAGATGVHLPMRSLPADVARRLLGAGWTVGVSAHGVDQVAAAATAGADYAFVGTLFPTPSHEGLSGIGPSGLREALAGASGMPLIGIGGISPERVGPVMAAGAHGVAVIRGVWERDVAASAVEAYLEKIEEAIA